MNNVWKLVLGELSESTVEEAINYCKNKKILSIDTETTGLDPHTNKIVLLQIGDAEKVFILDVRYIPKEIILGFKSMLEDKDIVKVGVNLSFDYKMLLSNFGIRMQSLKDCMIQNMVLFCNQGKKNSLEAMCDQYLGIKFGLDLFNIYPEKSTRLEFVNIGYKPLTEKQLMYSGNDVIYPILINEKQEKLIKDYKIENCIKLENDYIPVLAEMEYNGIYLDPIKWIKLYYDNKLEANEKLKVLNDIEEINWDSPKQVGDIFEEMNIPIKVVVDGKTKRTVAETHISQYKDSFDIIRRYLSYKGFKKAITTYGEKFLDNINHKSGRVHSRFLQILKTGRLSSSSPNLQNIPRPKEFRACFTADPRENTTLVVADYSGQELRILADKANESKMLDEFLYGDGDIHSLTAKFMFGKKKITYEERQKGKITNFLMCFGGGASKLAKQFNIPFQRAKQLVHNFFKGYPSLEKYFNVQFRLTKDRGFILIDPVTNRRTWHPYHELLKFTENFIENYEANGWNVPKEIRSAYGMSKSKIERDSKNFPIQGTAASMTKLACILLYKWQLKNNLFDKFKLVLCIHDEIVLEVDRNYVDKVSKQLRECMLKAGAVFVKKVPMEVEIKITDFWTH